MRNRTRVVGVLTGVAVVLLAAGVALWAWHARSGAAVPSANVVPASWARPVVSAHDLGDRSGVEITRVAVSGDGGLVDLRFKVIDPNRAATLHDARTPPAVVDEKTGLVVHQLLMNHAHSGAFKPGVTYYLVFENPGNWVRRGGRVTVLLGDAQVEHVQVR